MSMSPGLWHVMGNEVRSETPVGREDRSWKEWKKDIVCKGENPANLTAIAALPELLHALKEMLRQFEEFDPGADDGVSDCDAIVLARAAIAKVEGQS